jgi:nodulation protein E
MSSSDDSYHRVVITGMGCISALGADKKSFWRALLEGKSGIGPVSDASHGCHNPPMAAKVRDFDANRHFRPRQIKLLDPFAQLAVVAAREAIAESGLCFSGAMSEQTAIIVGTGFAGDKTINDAARRIYGEGNGRARPVTIPRAMTNAAVSNIAIENKIRGPGFAISSACASASHAIGMASLLIRHGYVSAAIAGGSDSCLNPGTLTAWEALRVMAPDTCRPFSQSRKGMVLGEGAAVLVLESLNSARRRGAVILAELSGFGMSSDAVNLVSPSRDGATRAIQAALSAARMNPEWISYVNAHGSGTISNDLTETHALHRVFGLHARRLAISGTKSMHGHAMGAAGALEAVATVMAIQTGMVPPTANYIGPDHDCDLDYIPNEARDIPIGAALSNSFAFGGLNAVLAFARFG